MTDWEKVELAARLRALEKRVTAMRQPDVIDIDVAEFGPRDGGVWVDMADAERPIGMQVDGYMSLADAEELCRNLADAIAWHKERIAAALQAREAQ